MGGGDVGKQDQNQAMFQNNPWNRPRDDGGWNQAPQSGEWCECCVLLLFCPLIVFLFNVCCITINIYHFRKK